jgi:hypothetical protein
MTTTDPGPVDWQATVTSDGAPVPTPDEAPPVVPGATVVTGVPLLSRWQQSEPIRLYLYGLLGAVLPLLTIYGAMTGEAAALWGAAAAAALGVPATEGLRSQVYSPRTTLQLLAGAGR